MKHILAMLSVCFMVAALGYPLFAVSPGDVVVGQDVVLRIRYAAGGMSVRERADEIRLRVNSYLGDEPFHEYDVVTAVRGGEWVVLIKGKLLVTADKRTAKFNTMTPEQLAKAWAANLRRAIPSAKALPPL